MAVKKGIRYTYNYDDIAAEAVRAGKRAYAKFLRGKSTRWLTATLALTLVIAVGGGTAVRGVGSPWQIMDEVGLDMGGRATAFSPYHLLALSDYLTSSKRTYTRLTCVAAGTYNLVEQVIIPFEYPNRQMRGSEVRFREDDTTKDMSFFYKLASASGNPDASKIVAANGSVDINTITMTVSQNYDGDLLADPPVFRPWFEEKAVDVTQATTKGFIDLELTDLTRGITILQMSDLGLVSDIINKIRVKGTNYSYLGDNDLVDYANWARGQEFEDMGGDVYAPSAGGMIHVDFAKLKLSKALNPNQDGNFRVYVDAQPSSLAGAASSQIVVLLSTLERNPKLRPDKQYVTSPTLPASLDATAV